MIQFFSEIDRKIGPKGEKHIASEHPAWYHEGQIRELRETISEQQNALDMDMLQGQHKAMMREQLAKNKQLLSQLEASRPVLNDEQRGKLGKALKDMKGLLSETIPSREKRDRRQVDPGDLARTMTTPCIKVPAEVAQLAVTNGVGVTKDGKMSQNDISRLYKWSARLLGEDSRVESLRRDR